MKVSSVLSVALLPVSTAFLVARPTVHSCSRLQSLFDEELFEDEEDEMFPIAENYLRAKYRQTAASHGHKQCDESDAREVLRSVLPPVTADELQKEVDKTMELVRQSDPDSTKESIAEDSFVKAIVQNSYWQQAGSLVVKELMYFDALYNYYRNGVNLLNNEDYETLKENLTWEGSSVATMKADEALFVTAIASSSRGQAIMDDDEYAELKSNLKKANSWVTARGQDALEKLGLNTFLGYLHRAL